MQSSMEENISRNNDYHLQFVNDDCDPDFPADVNFFLDHLFAPQQRPLGYLAHRRSQCDGMSTVQVSL